MQSLDDLNLFALTVRYQGISAAAKACHMQRSKVSRRLQELEKKLGYQLLIRTTRTIELTKQGQWLYDQICTPLITLTEATELLEEQNRTPRGKLRIAIPPVLGVTEFFTNVIERYTSMYPEVQLEIQHQKQAIDLRRTNTDIQILPAYHPVIHDDYVQQHLIQLPCCMIASTSYIEARGEPETIDDISEHLFLGSRYSKTQLPPDVDYYVYSEDLHLLRNLARDGKGITLLPSVMVKQGLENGCFERLLKEHLFGDLKVKLIYPSLPYLSEKSRSMVTLLRETLKEEGVISYPA